MASVKKRERDGKTTYLVRWRDEAGRQLKRSFDKKLGPDGADAFKARVEHDLRAGTYVDLTAGKVTVRDYGEQWRLAQPHRPNTAARVEVETRCHIYPALGDRPIGAIRPSEVQGFIGALSTRRAPGTVRNVFATLSAMFAAAMRDRLIQHDPTERIKLPQVHQTKVEPLTVEQVERLIAALPRRYQAVAVTAAGTGMRLGELFGLRVRDLDLLRRVVRVEQQVQPHGLGPLKNRSAYRTIPVGKVVADALSAHLAEYPAGPDDFVFRYETGGPLHRGLFKQPWESARIRAGLRTAGMHDFRHFYASALIASGQSVKVVSERLGHTNAAMTLNRYSHLWPDDSDRTRQAIDEVFGAAPPTRPEDGSSSLTRRSIGM